MQCTGEKNAACNVHHTDRYSFRPNYFVVAGCFLAFGFVYLCSSYIFFCSSHQIKWANELVQYKFWSFHKNLLENAHLDAVTVLKHSQRLLKLTVNLQSKQKFIKIFFLFGFWLKSFIFYNKVFLVICNLPKIKPLC